jgi:hypothetical protein
MQDKKSALSPHVDEIQEGDIVIAPWIDAKHGTAAILEIYGRGAETISILRKKGKVSICGFKEAE